MADLSLKISIIILKVNDLNAPTEDRVLQNGWKNMTQLYAVCKKLISIIML